MPQAYITSHASQVAGIYAEPFQLENEGPGVVYVGSDSSVSTINYEKKMAVGTSIGWSSNTTLYAVTADGDTATLTWMYGALNTFSPAPDSVTVLGTVSIDGTVQIAGNVGIVGPVSVSGTVAISGPVTVNGNVGITGPVSVTGTVGVSGPVTVTGTVAISGSVAISGPVSISGGVSVTGSTINVGETTLSMDTLQSAVTTDLTAATRLIYTSPSLLLYQSLTVDFIITTTSGSSIVLPNPYLLRFDWSGTSGGATNISNTYYMTNTCELIVQVKAPYLRITVVQSPYTAGYRISTTIAATSVALAPSYAQYSTGTNLYQNCVATFPQPSAGGFDWCGSWGLSASVSAGATPSIYIPSIAGKATLSAAVNGGASVVSFFVYDLAMPNDSSAIIAQIAPTGAVSNVTFAATPHPIQIVGTARTVAYTLWLNLVVG